MQLSASPYASILQWHLDMGVDEAISSLPFALHIPEALPREQSQAAPAASTLADTSAVVVAQAKTAAPSANHAQALAEARALAAASTSIGALHAALQQFHGCSLRKTASNTVFADGNPTARLMLVGEAPGAEEDKQGIPFCGASGKLLDKMLASIGIERQGESDRSAYITNCIFWRPPGNRQPTIEETELCWPFVERHIALVAPKLLIAVGATAARVLINQTQSMSRLRGKRFHYGDMHIPTLVTYHPSYLLRQPVAKRQAWQDMLQTKEIISD